jgi:hypothetical protein
VDVEHVAKPSWEFIFEFNEAPAKTSESTGVCPVLVGGDRSSFPQGRYAMGKIHPQEAWTTKYLKRVPTLSGCPKFFADFPLFSLSQTAQYP